MKLRILLFLILFPYLLHSQSRADSVLTVLNNEISNRTVYYSQKENRISDLKVSLSNISNEYEKFSLNDKIYNEYKSYQYDSAYVYAVNTKKIATKLKDRELLLTARCNLLFCFISSGLFKEAVDIVNNTDVSGASDSLTSVYYSQCARLYSDLVNYNTSEPYKTAYQNKSIEYCDSALMYLSPSSYDYHNILALKDVNAGIIKKIATYSNLIYSFDVDNHQLAINTSILGNLYMYQSDDENAVYYMALSAISDIRSAITETTSKTNLAKYLYTKGNIKDASRYIGIALEEANFYNARHRMMDVNSILPIIEKERLNIIEDQRDNLTISLIIVSILSALFFASSIINYKQNKKLKEAKQTIQDNLNELSSFNDKLNSTNEKLKESNAIKDQYVIQSLYGKSEYLDKTEGLLKKLDNRLKARQYDDIYRLYAEFDLKSERENIFSSFDSTFLGLFPNFLEEFNKLFPEGDRINIEDHNLTPELRIFALIRIGINDNEKIARFLNLSVNTIYVYKAKIKSRSIVPKEEFEYRIMRIKKNPA
ncbi:DUF6377 domain-containing protein [Prevotella sp. 10(H)]|uniref:DUF6377 domain-containing protein n=1 Tax=Prevotella sp. 10(H) TaxID=1158294 RepID=UPI0006912E52|nr:DUF6377 domain-containing protein [Prevotella sp. 10(H)]